MAGDWIKMRTNLGSDPAVIGLAIATGLDEDTIVGKLHKLWSWADQHTQDGHAVGVTPEWLDRLVSVKNFSVLLEKQGWLSIKKSGIVVPNFEVHNGKSAKRRALAAKRKVTQRSRKGHAPSVTKTGPEKRREREEVQTTPLPPFPEPLSVPVDTETEPEYQHLTRSFFKQIEELFDRELVFQWRGFQIKLLKDQVDRLGETKVLDVIRDAAKGISAPGITDRAQYLLKIVERYDPAVEKAKNAHWGRVICKTCGKTHKILMPIDQRKLYWTSGGQQLAIRCGCGESVPTGKRIPERYDVSELRDIPSNVEEALTSG